MDDDCDGVADEELVGCCQPGNLERCSVDVGLCEAGERLCTAERVWGACDGVVPTLERCNGRDDDCDGELDEDFDLTSDRRHCGACGRACGEDHNCVVSECILQCDPPEDECGDECVDLLSHPLHCGDCERACPDDQTCVEGECTCALEGWGGCGGRCVDLRGDPLHCSECGEECEDGVECRYGHCGIPELLEGVQLDMPEAELLERGWVGCWRGAYGQVGQNIRNTILADCNGPMLVMACRPVNNANLSVLAMGNRGDVLNDQGRNRSGRHDANGVGWYYSDSYPWGFVRAGTAVSRNSCDTGQEVPQERLCWHTGGGNVTSGYRCGATTLNGNNGWERLIYHVPVD